jgi:hypothetical protein
LQFITELHSQYQVGLLHDEEPSIEAVGIRAYNLHASDLYFTPESRMETLVSTALGARDSTTGQSVAFSMMRTCPRLVGFADELILLVTQYLLLPCISDEMRNFVEKYKETG